MQLGSLRFNYTDFLPLIFLDAPPVLTETFIICYPWEYNVSPPLPTRLTPPHCSSQFKHYCLCKVFLNLLTHSNRPIQAQIAPCDPQGSECHTCNFAFAFMIVIGITSFLRAKFHLGRNCGCNRGQKN
jgi:hypothetical protein